MTSSSSSPGLAVPPRYSTPRTGRASYGPKVADVAEALGLPLMPWQRHVADVALEVRPDTGQLAFRTIVISVPRQSGKTTLALSVAVHRALGFGGPQHCVYTAQTGSDARKKLVDDQLPILARSPFSGLHTVRLTNGAEAIKWTNGSLHTITAGTEKAGHGQVVDLAFLDEAFAHVDARIETALRPAMVTRPNAQLWIISTMGTDASLFLNEKVEIGRQAALNGVTEGICYFEWSADPHDDPASITTWQSCMPALKWSGNPSGTTPIESVAADHQAMPLPEFRRSYLNIKDDKRNDPVISAADWSACLNETATQTHPVALAFDVAPDRSTTCIAAASTDEDGRCLVEVIEHHSGTSWVVDRLDALIDKYRPSCVIADARGPSGSIVAEAQNAGIEIELVATGEATAACGGFYDDAVTHRLRHIGQPELTAAVDGADRRMVGDAWAWSRKSSSVDISPLVAVTLARWGHKTTDDYDPAEQVW